MKNLLTLTFFSIALIFQQGQAQTYQQDNKIFDVYFGGPNLYRAFLDAAYLGNSDFSFHTNSKVSGVGLFGVRGEMMVTDKLGIGLDVNFATAGLYYERENVIYNDDMNPINVVDTYKINQVKIGALASINYHFLQSTKFDLYFSGGVGYKYNKYKFEISASDFVEQSVTGIFPIAFKVGFGARYFITEELGVNFGFTAGHGGIINGGISYRLK